MSRLDVSAAGPGHAAVISSLHGICFDANLETVWDEKAVSELLAMPGAFAFIASLDEQPVGFALARRAADEAEIISIGTVPEARRRGVAKAMIETVLAKAAGDGAERMFLEVAADNEAALAFYLARGFVSCGQRPGYYRRPDGRVDAEILVYDLVTAGK